MKLDKIILFIFSLIRKKNYKEIETNLFVKKVSAFTKIEEQINPNSNKTYFILSGWYESSNHSKKFKKRIKKQKNSYIFYQLSKDILSSRANQVKEYMKEIKNKIIKDLKNTKNEKIIIGTSLGGIPSFMITNELRVNKLILLMPSDSLAQGVWEGLRTQNIKKSFIKQGIKLKKLKILWKELEPQNNLKNLEKTKIIIFNSKSDLIIPYKRSYNLIKEMHKKRIYPKVYTNKNIGHYLTALKFYNSKKSFDLIH
ncbi:MAG: YqiA/YcfP family alpha/beta fold hydrolase [Candidatus Pacearchaeota archaeon]|jgi:predicted esterase YcpF (UPF0227 family)